MLTNVLRPSAWGGTHSDDLKQNLYLRNLNREEGYQILVCYSLLWNWLYFLHCFICPIGHKNFGDAQKMLVDWMNV